jgi:uncharacterized protein (TIGR02246 family)
MRRRRIELLVCMVLGCTAVNAQPPSQPDQAAVRALIKAFADARNAHDVVSVVALYADEGVWISETGGQVRGRAGLLKLWNGVSGHVDRTISSIDFPAPHIAVVRVATQYADARGLHSEAFILVEENGFWKIRIHESIP